MRLRMRIISLAAVAVTAGGVAACAPAAGRASSRPAAMHAPPPGRARPPR